MWSTDRTSALIVDVDGTVDRFGALHCAVNNAGTELAVAIDSSDAAAFSTVLATNLEGERVPNGALTVFPGEGHYLDARHHPEMLEFLTGWR